MNLKKGLPLQQLFTSETHRKNWVTSHRFEGEMPHFLICMIETNLLPIIVYDEYLLLAIVDFFVSRNISRGGRCPCHFLFIYVFLTKEAAGSCSLFTKVCIGKILL